MAIKVHYFITIDPSLFKNIINILVNNLNLYVNQTEDIEKQTTDYIVSWKVFVDNDITK
jgi:hypothetical protein